MLRIRLVVAPLYLKIVSLYILSLGVCNDLNVDAECAIVLFAHKEYKYEHKCIECLRMCLY